MRQQHPYFPTKIISLRFLWVAGKKSENNINVRERSLETVQKIERDSNTHISPPKQLLCGFRGSLGKRLCITSARLSRESGMDVTKRRSTGIKDLDASQFGALVASRVSVVRP